MKIAILDDYLDAARGAADWRLPGIDASLIVLREPLRGQRLIDAIGDADVVVAMRERTPFDAGLIGALGRLRLLVTTGMRNRAIDIAACHARGIVVCGTGSDPLLAAEQAWALIMGAIKRVPEDDRAVRAGAWQTGLGGTLRGRILGLVGLGRLGQRMARFAQAFDMPVLAWSPNLTAERCAAAGVEPAERQALFERSDIVSLHMVLGERTRHLVGARELGWMKPHSWLVNTSRAGLVDTDALIDTLRHRRIAGAALDVFDQEPLPAAHPITTLPNVLLSPHVGYASRENFATYYQDAVADIQAWAAGAPIRVLEP